MDLDQKQEPWISVNDKMPVVGVPVHCQLKGCWSGKIVEYDLFRKMIVRGERRTTTRKSAMTSMSSPGDLFRFGSLALSGGYCRENTDVQTMFYSNTSLGAELCFLITK